MTKRRALPFLLGASLVLAPLAAAAERVHASAEEVEPLATGSRVPAVTLRSVRGEPVELAALVRERGALLVFYRGGW